MVKNILRRIVSNAVGLIVVPYIIEGFEVPQQAETIFIGAVVLSLVNLFVKPVVKFVSFPINFITLGFFGWVINALMLYLVVFAVDGINLTAGKLRLDLLDFGFQPVEMHWIVTLIAAALGISMVNWILKKFLL